MKDILNASRMLLQKQGWAALNIRTVAKECNISVGSVYNYFQNKSDLIASIIVNIFLLNASVIGNLVGKRAELFTKKSLTEIRFSISDIP